jgi:hypothetical protein
VARRGFGGSGDYSSFFSGLYSFNKNEAQAREAAADQDAADRWANGLMSDDEWLSYIRAAIDREAGSPKDQQRWITALRKYSTLIADKQAEQAYESGGSINDLIAHYEQRLAGMVKDSNEYRETQLRLNDLMDFRAGEQISEKAEAIIDGINAGTKTYQDLKALFVEALATSRPNSDLKKQLEDQLDKVNETIRVNKLEGEFEKNQYEYDAGKISGKTYAARLRAQAQQFKDNDPKRYYQILQAAVTLERNAPGVKGSGGGGGGGGGGSSSKSINKSIDAIQADRNGLQSLIAQYESGAKRGVDPMTGAVVVFSPEKVKELDRQLLSQFDRLTAAYETKGDLSAAANTQKAKMAFVSENIVGHNTLAADDASRELMVSTSKLLQTALDNPDPTRAMSTVQYVAKQWSTFATSLTKTTITTDAYAGDKSRNLPAEAAEQAFGGEKGLLDLVDPELISRAEAFSAAMSTLATPGLDDASASAALESLEARGGGQSSPFVKLGASALEINGRQQGLMTGDIVRIATSNGLTWARTETMTVDAPDPMNPANMVQVQQKVPTLVRTPGGTWEPLKVDGQKTKLVDVFVDVNGTPTKMQAIATLTSPTGFDAWVAGSTKAVNGVQLVKGQPLTEEQLKKIANGKPLDYLKAIGLLDSATVMPAWKVTVPGYTDKYGNQRGAESWSQDPTTGVWYKGSLPIRGVQRDEYGMVKFTKDGAAIDWRSYAGEIGVPAPYAGANAKAMQDLLNSGVVDVSGLRGRDLLGRPVDDQPLRLDSAYWDRTFPPAEGRDSWWKDDERKARADTIKIQNNKRREAQFGEPVKEPNRDLLSTIIEGASELASAFGINLNGIIRPAEDKFDAQSTAKAEGERWAAMGDWYAKQAKQASVAPTVRLPDPKTTASGPALKAEINLPTPKTAGLALPDIEEIEAAYIAKSKSTSTAPKVQQPAPTTTTYKSKGGNLAL